MEYTVQKLGNLAGVSTRTYYVKNQPGIAKFLRDAVLIYTGMKK